MNAKGIRTIAQLFQLNKLECEQFDIIEDNNNVIKFHGKVDHLLDKI